MLPAIFVNNWCDQLRFIIVIMVRSAPQPHSHLFVCDVTVWSACWKYIGLITISQWVRNSICYKIWRMLITPIATYKSSLWSGLFCCRCLSAHRLVRCALIFPSIARAQFVQRGLMICRLHTAAASSLRPVRSIDVISLYRQNFFQGCSSSWDSVNFSQMGFIESR